MTQTNIYAYAQPIDNLFGGPIYAVATVITFIEQPLDYWDFSVAADINTAKKFVDALTNQITAVDYRITSDEINYLGWTKASSAKLNMAVARLAYEQKIFNPTVVLGHRNLLPLDEFTCRRDSYSNESIVTRAIASLKRHWVITEHYAKCYPQYDLLNNYGYLNQRSLPVLLREPIVEGFSLYEPLKRLPTLYINALKQLSPDFILNDPQLTVRPYWWKTRYPGLPFFSPSERLDYDRYTKGNHPATFLQWLPEVNEESKERANGRRNRCHLDQT